MPKGYVIVTEAVKDEAGMAEYGRASAPTLAGGGARILAFDAEPAVLEGDWHGPRTVLLEFESPEAARAWYESDAYQRALPLRLAAADCNAALLSGFEMPPRSAKAQA